MWRGLIYSLSSIKIIIMKSIATPITNGFVPCCYFPTITILIDDNPQFTQAFGMAFGKEQIYKEFDNPDHALEFLKQQSAHAGGFLRDYFSPLFESAAESKHAIDIDIPRIHTLIFNKPLRYEEPSVIVIDYAMPSMTGIEFCQQLKKSVHSPIKVIMLTGEGDDHVGVNAFNEGVINRFVLKSSPDASDKVMQYIAELRLKFFQDISRTLLESLKAQAATVLEEPAFIKLFNQICAENAIVEYYLLEESGSFLLLDKHGNVTRLIIKSDADLQSLYEIASGERGIPESVAESLRDRKKLVYFPDNKARMVSPKHWPLEEAKPLQGKKATYYYSIIKGTDRYPLESKNIATLACYFN